MTLTQYTPPPWFQSHRNTAALGDNYSTQVYTEDGETIATLHWYPKPKDNKGAIGTYREANARLIAAAPELLEALQIFMAEHDNTYDGEPLSIEMFTFVEKARSAISKATA